MKMKRRGAHSMRKNLKVNFDGIYALASEQRIELAIVRCDMSEPKKNILFSVHFSVMFASLLFCLLRAFFATFLRRELIMQITFARIDVVKAKTTHVHRPVLGRTDTASWRMLAGEQSGNFHLPCEVD